MKLTTRLLLLLTLYLPTVVFAGEKIDATSRRFSTVVLDAGHGGKDPGCSWGEYKEKDLNLRVTLALGKMIEEAYPEVTVIYTRKDDRFIELHERGDIANRANADLFISIHTDAVSNTASNGSSTYIMGNDKSEKNLEVAKRENAVVVLEGDYEQKYEGYDPNSTESFIIFSLMQYAYSEQSMEFAEMVQKHYSKTTQVVDRGARQGPYLVLWRTTMPAVLTEMGFMTNKKDREYLQSAKGQADVVKALFDAFSEYRDNFNRRVGNLYVEAVEENPATPEVKREESGKTIKEASAPTPKQEVVAESKGPKQEVVAESKGPKQIAGPKSDGTMSQKGSVTAQSVTTTTSYFVQICTLSKKSDPNDRKFGPYRGKIEQYQTQTGKWRCVVPAESLEEARRLQPEANKSFAGAFVVVKEGEEFRRM